MEITFLGTSCMMPTKERNHSALFLEYKGDGILFDCGEGMQRQFATAGIRITKVTKILITHFHGDHMLGLAGLLQSLAQNGITHTVELYGPVGTKEFMKHVYTSMYWDKKCPTKIIEVEKREFFDGEDFRLEALPMDHRVPCLGYAFIEKDRLRINVAEAQKRGIPDGPLLGQLQQGKPIAWKGQIVSPKDLTYTVPGKKIVLITDTSICQNCFDLAKDADLLISEATLSSKLGDKAESRGHLTARDAGLIASKAGAKKLILTHFSTRYKNTQELEEDATSVFDKVMCAQDLLRVRL